MRQRSFPALQLRARVRRYPGYYTVNVAIPSGSFAALTFLAFFIPVDEPDARLTVSLTMVLVAAAYKVSLVGMLPQIAYLTVRAPPPNSPARTCSPRPHRTLVSSLTTWLTLR